MTDKQVMGSKAALVALCKNDPLVADFIYLTSFDTQADGESKAVPSTVGQLRLSAALHQKLSATGVKTVQEETGVLLATLPASEGCEKAPRLCLIAHLDTAPDASGANVSPRLVSAYPGGTITLDNGLKLTEEFCPELRAHVGEEIIVTDGTTLLGADDKAGVAVLLNLIKDCVKSPEEGGLRHGPLKVVFSVDEEIGLSCGHLNVEKLESDVAVTVDGCERGEVDVETFNAAEATVTFRGVAVHTAVAKGKLKSALKRACEFVTELPAAEAPESTAGREGFYHPHHLQGSVESASVKILLRDFEADGLERRKALLRELVLKFNERYGEGTVSLEINFQYHNLKAYLDKAVQESGGALDPVAWCVEACKAAGVKVELKSVRGGTDGSNLSARGLPCPNLFTGALNCHGVYECLPVPSLHASLDTVRSLVTLIADKTRS